MPIFRFENDNVANAKPLDEISLASGGISEDDIRNLLALHLDRLEKEEGRLKLIAREYGNWEDSKRRLDILALEATEEGGRLVVIELKRDNGGAHAELQSLRYAAMVSTHTFDHVAEALTNERRKLDPSFSEVVARQELLDFLGVSGPAEVKLDDKPRIILLAQSFSKELTTTVLWLYQHFGLDIACYTVTLYKLNDGSRVLYFDKLLPLKEQEEYVVKVREKMQQEAEQQKAKQRLARATTILEERDLLKDGDELTLLVMPRAQMMLPEEQTRAIYLKGGRVRWCGEEFSSVTALTQHICQETLGKSFAIAGTAYWGKNGVTLYDMAKNAINA